MAITVDTLTITALKQFPFDHSGDAMKGRTARVWPVQAILTPSDWLALNQIYLNWRNNRINDPDTMLSMSVGTTVPCSGTLYGMTWNNVQAWFTQAPQPTTVGAMIGVSFELIDANQQLEILLKERELEENATNEENEFVFGNYTLGTIIVNLTDTPDTDRDGPRIELAGTGTHVIRGPLTSTKVKQIKGWTETPGADATIMTWYRNIITTTPAKNSWYPVTVPDIQWKPTIKNGLRITRYEVSVELVQIK